MIQIGYNDAWSLWVAIETIRRMVVLDISTYLSITTQKYACSRNLYKIINQKLW